MPEFPLRLNNKIVPREQSWRRNSQPNEEVGRLNRLQVNEQTWALGDTNNGMVHSPVEQTMPVQLNDDAEDSFPEEIPVSDFAISSPVGVQVIPHLLQRDQRDFQTTESYDGARLEMGVSENPKDETRFAAAMQARVPRGLEDQIK